GTDIPIHLRGESPSYLMVYNPTVVMLSLADWNDAPTRNPPTGNLSVNNKPVNEKAGEITRLPTTTDVGGAQNEPAAGKKENQVAMVADNDLTQQPAAMRPSPQKPTTEQEESRKKESTSTAQSHSPIATSPGLSADKRGLLWLLPLIPIALVVFGLVAMVVAR